MKKVKEATLKGNLFLLNTNDQSFASAQVELLTAIDHCGSISSAAKRVGISYKTAWDRIDAMNNMSEQPLVIRSAGGSHGGGTRLTPLGQQIIQGFMALQKEHEAFIERVGHQLHSLNDVARFVRNTTMKTSARNQFRGEVTKVTPGTVNAEVELRIGDRQYLTAIITSDSLVRLNLKVGSNAVALIKASWVLLSKDTALKSSARNQLTGQISRVAVGAVNSDVTVDLGDGKSLCAIITNTSVKALALQEGDEACAFFKASNVILMTE